MYKCVVFFFSSRRMHRPYQVKQVQIKTKMTLTDKNKMGSKHQLEVTKKGEIRPILATYDVNLKTHESISTTTTNKISSTITLTGFLING